MIPARHQALPGTLAARFAANPARHAGLAWVDVLARLDARPAVLESLQAMEATGGEPDVTGVADDGAGVVFCDCAAESPAGRRSVCFDGEARRARKAHPPKRSALEMAASMGIALLDEDRYVRLQALGEFDRKTSSWIATPPAIRELDGALFGDRRNERVFVHHNGAQSYYTVRGFRGFVVA